MERKPTEEENPLLETTTRGKGGYRTLPFIVANEAFEKMATYGLTPNMTLYLMNEYYLKMTSASNILFIWSSTTSFMPLIGAITADSFLGQFRTIGFGSIICLLGMGCLWLTTVIPQAKPSPCDDRYSETCSSKATFLQLLFLCTSFGLISIGAGGIRSCSLAFGANQIEKTESLETKSGVKESYFGWYYGAYTLSVLIGLTCVVYIQANMGWGIGFAIPVVLMTFGVVSFHLASPFYVKSKSESSLITSFLRVIVASYRKRNLKTSESDDDTVVVYHSEICSDIASPSSNLRFLNKACIVQDPQNELSPDGTASDPWRLCTVDQVEDLKSLLRVIPMWSSGTIMAVNLCQTSFPVLQASSMDRHITSSFEIPAASLSTFAVISVIIWICLYQRAIVPLASRALKRPFHLSTTKRMGLGIFLSLLSVTVSAVVENTRRRLAIDEGLVESPQANVHMSGLWLIPQYCLLGFAEASNAIAQNEFYFSEFPKRMSSIATSMLWVGMALANLIASLLMNVVDGVSKAGGRESWFSSNINKGHYDYYYLVLAGLSLGNIVYFIGCSKAYGPLKEEKKITGQECSV